VQPDPVLSARPLGFQWDTVDPFLFCVHHDDALSARAMSSSGPRARSPGATSATTSRAIDGWRMYHGDVVPGFPQHPHRGFETMTIVRKRVSITATRWARRARFGDGDTCSGSRPGRASCTRDVPACAARRDNPLELFQLWLNLPRRASSRRRTSRCCWREATPVRVEQDSEGRATAITVIAGDLADTRALPPPPDSWAARADSDVAIWSITMAPGAPLDAAAGARGEQPDAVLLPRGGDPRGRARGRGAHGVAAAAGGGGGAGERRDGRRVVAAAGQADRGAGGAARALCHEHAGTRSRRPSRTIGARASAAGRGAATGRAHARSEGRFALHADGRRETRLG
jgi:redox-sensitive bicupin YhaK (pirin superfamily)